MNKDQIIDVLVHEIEVCACHYCYDDYDVAGCADFERCRRLVGTLNLLDKVRDVFYDNIKNYVDTELQEAMTEEYFDIAKEKVVRKLEDLTK